jgi:succinoglycan biosynthesis protein ExoV
MDPINYCHIAGGNFGDDLNALLWHSLFPDLSALRGRVLLYGVGTLLDGIQNTRLKKVVLGSGLGEARGAVVGVNWDFRWVRGPKTAGRFGISTALGLGDPAILWSGLQGKYDTGGPVGLIPHYATWDGFDWTMVGAKAGLAVINPRQSPDTVVAGMRRCSRVLAESLHGAICADAMGIPWAPCVLAHRFNEFKWRDWLATIDRPYLPLMLDRPLVRRISKSKAFLNRLARWLQYQRQTRHPHLRPTTPATPEDIRCVANTLAAFCANPNNFYCSPVKSISAQRRRMLQSCAEFANDYHLHFTPPQAIAT